MPLLGATAAQAKFAQFLIRAGAEIAGAVAGFLLTNLNFSGDAPEVATWRRIVFSVPRLTPTGTSEDKATFSMDLVNVTGDEWDNTWTQGDYDTIDALIGTWRTAILPYLSPAAQTSEWRSYIMAFPADPNPQKPFVDSGPPEYVRSLNFTGTGTGVLPYQVAMSVTERTPWPKHWGRFYPPCMAASAVDGNGRWTAAARTGVANATKALYSGLYDAGFYPVVPVTQVDKVPVQGLLSITKVVVDDIPDVQRSRRAKIAAARTIGV